MNKIPITETFLSLEGECNYVGIPTLFIRVFGCDVKCPKCDTKNSWKTNDKISFYTTQELVYWILSCLENNPGVNRVSFTGGNPMLFILELQEVIKEIISHATKNNIRLPLINLEHPGYYSHSNEYEIPYYLISGYFSSITLDIKLFFADSYESKIDLIWKHLTKCSSTNTIFKFIVETSEDLKALRQVLLCLTKSKSNIINRAKYEECRFMIDDGIRTQYTEESPSDIKIIMHKAFARDIQTVYNNPKFIAILRDGNNIDKKLFEEIQKLMYEIPDLNFNFPMHVALNFK